MAAENCDNCGLPLFFNHSVWSSGPDGQSSHHGCGPKACEEAAAAIERMPAALDAAVEALVEAQDAAGGLIFQGSDDEYSDVEALQKALHEAYARTSDGIREVSAALRGDTEGGAE